MESPKIKWWMLMIWEYRLFWKPSYITDRNRQTPPKPSSKRVWIIGLSEHFHKNAIFGKEKQGCRFALEHFRWDPARLAPFGRFRQLRQRIPVRCQSVVSEFSQASLETRTVKELKKMCKDRNRRSRLEPSAVTMGANPRATPCWTELPTLWVTDRLIFIIYRSFGETCQCFQLRHIAAVEGPIFNKPMVWPCLTRLTRA